jgi:hypothetical protein
MLRKIFINDYALAISIAVLVVTLLLWFRPATDEHDNLRERVRRLEGLVQELLDRDKERPR